LMEVYGVDTGRQILEIEFHNHAWLLGGREGNGDGTYVASLSVLQFDHLLLSLRYYGSRAESERGTNHEGANCASVVHSREFYHEMGAWPSLA
jgi:hypothetical protein